MGPGDNPREVRQQHRIHAEAEAPLFLQDAQTRQLQAVKPLAGENQSISRSVRNSVMQ